MFVLANTSISYTPTLAQRDYAQPKLCMLQTIPRVLYSVARVLPSCSRKGWFPGGIAWLKFSINQFETKMQKTSLYSGDFSKSALFS